MADRLTILYRGPLAACNYACWYCPCARRPATEEMLEADRAALERFCHWAEGWAEGDNPRFRLSVFFAPWGEALVHCHYREALARLGRLAHVDRVAIQTNLSCRLDWIGRCGPGRVALWCTYHPGQAAREAFLAQCRRLDAAGVRYSVGVVGLKEHFDEIAALRRELPARIYLWINAFKRQPGYYAEEDVRRLEAIDPLFRLSVAAHPSLGRACRTGETAIAVDGDGTIRRCFFVDQALGNLYEPGFERCLRARPCPNATCRCHIGYVHLAGLGLEKVFGDGLLERIPCENAAGMRRVPSAPD